MRLRDHFSQAYILDRFIVFLQYIVHEIPPDEYETDDGVIMSRFRDEFRTLNYWYYVDTCDRRTINQRLKWYTRQDDRWVEGLDVI